jgi:SAM-dependent methyltransferase
MTLKMPSTLASLVCCPRCKSHLVAAEPQSAERAWLCSDESCDYATIGFPAAESTPVLVDFENSVVSRENASRASCQKEPSERLRDTKHAFRNVFLSSPGPTAENARLFLEKVHEVAERPVILIIGGATVGNGAEALYQDRDVIRVSTDIYRTEMVDVLADGHHLPFADKTVHGVWIQAVLEHVLEPHRVAREIHRVLGEDGVVYAETPFMQQVHMGRYDFTRFTLSGHRWLFRGFEEISSGITRGPGTSMLWSLRYFFSALFGTYKAGTLVAIAFFWLRFFDRLVWPKHAVDGASGVYFLGQRSNRAIGPKEMLAHYNGAL